MNIILREEAKAKGLGRYFTGVACQRGHVSERNVSRGACLRCKREAQDRYAAIHADLIAAREARYRERNLEKIKKQLADHYQRNREKRVAEVAEYRRLHPEKAKKCVADYRAAHKEEAKSRTAAWRAANPERARTASLSWKVKNPERVRARNVRRRAIQAGSSVRLTADEELQIAAIYRERAEISRRTGVQHHVDHVIPLSKGGMHHPSNLQIITATENLRKGARC